VLDHILAAGHQSNVVSLQIILVLDLLLVSEPDIMAKMFAFSRT